MSSVDTYSSAKPSNLDNNAIYYEVSPTIIWVLRIYNVIMLLMVVVAFIICIVKGHENQTNYLLACNLVLSSLVSIVINWWYKKNELSSDKYWYIFLLSSVVIFQAITTDIYVFHTVPGPVTPTPPATSTFTASWATINSSTLTPPRPPQFVTKSGYFSLLNDSYIYV